MPPLGLEPWTFLIEHAHSTQNRVQNPKLPSLHMHDNAATAAAEISLTPLLPPLPPLPPLRPLLLLPSSPISHPLCPFNDPKVPSQTRSLRKAGNSRQPSPSSSLVTNAPIYVQFIHLQMFPNMDENEDGQCLVTPRLSQTTDRPTTGRRGAREEGTEIHAVWFIRDTTP